jgi:hypothetical protein
MSTQIQLTPTLTVDQRANDRRQNVGRRTHTHATPPTGDEHRSGERRNKVERRRQIDPTTCERDYSRDEVDFMKAMDDYKRMSGRQFPTWSEVLEVVYSLGYRRVAEPSEIQC